MEQYRPRLKTNAEILKLVDVSVARPNQKQIAQTKDAQTKLEGDKEEDEGIAGQDNEAKEGSRGRRNNKKNLPRPTDGDTGTFATWAVHKLKMHNPPLQLGGDTVSFENSTLQVCSSLYHTLLPEPPMTSF